ncbi:MAG: Tad domain-containing protein [Pseudomonadota bacterium]
MLKNFQNLCDDELGGTLALTSIALPVCLGFAGLAVDVGHAYYTKSRLQAAAEASALWYADRLTSSYNDHVADNGRNSQSVWLLEQAKADGSLAGKTHLPNDLAEEAITDQDFTPLEWNPVDGEKKLFDRNEQLFLNAVKVDAELNEKRGNQIPTFFSSFFGFDVDLSQSAYAAAPIIPAFHLLSPTKDGAFTLSGSSDLDSSSLWINSNSDNAYNNLRTFANRGVSIVAVNGGSNVMDAGVWQDKFALPDLLADQDLPRGVFFCDHNNLIIEKVSYVSLDPGTYCGGLDIRDADTVFLNPGEYKFVDGPLKATEGSRVEGMDVLLHFVGESANLDLHGSHLTVGGRQSGDFRGLALSSDRRKVGRRHVLVDSNVQISGIAYLPSDAVILEGSGVNGVCHSLCFVSDTLEMRGISIVNWSPTLREGFLPSSLHDAPRFAPKVLEPYLRPFLFYPE